MCTFVKWLNMLIKLPYWTFNYIWQVSHRFLEQCCCEIRCSPSVFFIKGKHMRVRGHFSKPLGFGEQKRLASADRSEGEAAICRCRWKSRWNVKPSRKKQVAEIKQRSAISVHKADSCWVSCKSNFATSAPCNCAWCVQVLRSPKETFAAAMQSWRERCEKCVCLQGDYVEKWLHFQLPVVSSFFKK